MAYCLWKIFSSIVPVVWNLYSKPVHQPRQNSGRAESTYIPSSDHLAILELKLVDH
jgi:hypothetical protein